jgi:hypothetical protein
LHFNVYGIHLLMSPRLILSVDFLASCFVTTVYISLLLFKNP